MATLEIDGIGRVQVDDAFRSLSAADQQKTVAEIVASFGARGRASDLVGATGKAISPEQQLTTDYLNQQTAASQRTTPNIGAHEKNLVSADVFENDAGDVVFRDATGQIVPTDKNKHVVLRDPADGRAKVFARSDSTNEGVLSSAGRLMMTGLAAGAPTARPGLVAAPRTRPAPTVEALKNAATEGYQAPEVTGVELRAQSLTNLAERVRSELNASGLDENLAPKTFGILGKASSAPEGATVTGQNIESLRRTLGNAAGSVDATERKAAQSALTALDDFYKSVPAGDVLAGDTGQAAATIGEARANYGAAARAEKIDRKITQAELRAASANSGQNVTNTLRARIADILIDPKQRRGYSAVELAAMERIVRGTKTSNTLRNAGNLLGGGGGLGSIVTAGVGAAATGGWGAGLPVLGYALKKLGNALTNRQIDQLSEIIRSRSPLAGRVGGPVVEWSKAARAAEMQPSARTISSLTLASRNLSNNLKDAGITIAPDDLLRSLQGPVRAPAEDEQQ